VWVPGGVRRLEAGRVSVEAELGLRGCARGGGLGDAWRLALVTADARELLLIDDEGDGLHLGAAAGTAERIDLVDLGQSGSTS
jgi:hypothetical protein